MKNIIYSLSLIIAFTGLAFAEQDKEQKKQQVLQEAKSRAMANIDKRISILQSGKSCLSSANSREDLKSCRKTMKESMKSHREQSKAEREQFKSKMKQWRANKPKK